MPLTATTVAAVVAPGILIFVLPTISLIAREEDLLGRYSAGRPLYLAGLALVGLGVVLWALSGTRLGRAGLVGHALLTPAWLVLTMAPATLRAVACLAILLGVVGLMAWSALRPQPLLLERLGLFAALVLLVSALTTGLEVRAAGGSGATAGGAGEGEAGDRPTVYHVVLDEMQTEMFAAVLDDDLRGRLAGFTWYPEATTTWGRTEMSMASTMAGEEYDLEVPPGDYITEAFTGPRSALTRLDELGYWRTGYYHSPGIYGGDPGPFDERYLGREMEVEAAEDDAEELVTTLWAHAHLPGRLARWLTPEEVSDQLDRGVLLPEDVPPRSVELFRLFLDREADRPEDGRYELVHLILPHFPYVLGPDCGYRAGEETGPEDQSRCALSLVVELLDHLESLDRLTDATVVVQGDHGADLRLEEDGSLTGVRKDFYGEEWSTTRSRALLLVKPAGVPATAPLVESGYPAVLGDIMPTVFDAIGVDPAPGPGRTSLLADDLPDRPRRYYHFYDKDDDDLPDGEVHRYVIEEDGLSADSVVPVP